jgi:hypothetical protein
MNRGVFAGLGTVCIASVAFASLADAATLPTTRNLAIVWLERHQSADGSWGTGSRRWTATSEALLALAKAGRSTSVAARRAQGWLLHNAARAIDSRARSIRALRVSGVYVGSAAGALHDLAVGNGWGVTKDAAIDSYDTALVLGALKASGVGINGLTAKINEVLNRRRSDGGWSGDDVPTEAGVPESGSDRTTSAEVVRALFDVATSGDLTLSLFLISNAGSQVNAATPSLEIAARLAARHAWNATDSVLEAQLLNDARLTSGVWSANDPLVNAIGLLALVTKPGTAPPSCPPPPPPATPPDADGDGFQDCIDAFPNDPSEHLDSDHDGIPDTIDPDRDGDGMPNSQDAFPSNPAETADLDGDSLGNHADPDDDGDGIADLDEYEDGMDPSSVDSDGDLFADGSGNLLGIAKLPGAWDLDHDGKIDGEGDFDSDPIDPLDHPGKSGDMAPLGHPDARVRGEDAVVFLRALVDGNVIDNISGAQNRQIAEDALDANRDGRVDAGDGLTILNQAHE